MIIVEDNSGDVGDQAIMTSCYGVTIVMQSLILSIFATRWKMAAGNLLTWSDFMAAWSISWMRSKLTKSYFFLNCIQQQMATWRLWLEQSCQIKSRGRPLNLRPRLSFLVRFPKLLYESCFINVSRETWLELPHLQGSSAHFWRRSNMK